MPDDIYLVIGICLLIAHPFFARHYLQGPKEQFCSLCANGPDPDRSDCYYCHRSLLNLAPWDTVVYHIVIVWGAFFLGIPILHIAFRFWKIEPRLGTIIFLLGVAYCNYYNLKCAKESAEANENEDKRFKTRIQIYLFSLLRPSESTWLQVLIKNVVSKGPPEEKKSTRSEKGDHL